MRKVFNLARSMIFKESSTFPGPNSHPLILCRSNHFVIHQAGYQFAQTADHAVFVSAGWLSPLCLSFASQLIRRNLNSKIRTIFRVSVQTTSVNIFAKVFFLICLAIRFSHFIVINREFFDKGAILIIEHRIIAKDH